MLIVVVGAVFMLRFLQLQEILPPDSENPPAIPESGWTWIVEPSFDYWLFYCSVYDAFVANGEYILNESTGLPTKEKYTCEYTNWETDGHDNRKWAYDPELDLFGWVRWRPDGIGTFEMHPMKEFAERFPDEVDRIKLVFRIDSTVRHIEDGVEYLSTAGMIEYKSTTETVDGHAVAFGNEFITDFIYADFATNTRTTQVIGVPQWISSGKWGVGIMNKHGDVLVDFMFDALLTISENTAFARIGDYWGIIGFGNYTPDDVPETPWVVLDEFDYDEIAMCYCGDYFALMYETWFVIDYLALRHTNHGEYGFKDENCKGFEVDEMLYEPESNLLGFIREQEAFFFPLENIANLILPVAAEKIISPGLQEGEFRGDSFPDIEFTGKYAVLYCGEIITDFIFAGRGNGRTNHSSISLINSEGRHGIINYDGEVLLSFIFEDLFIINENTAFAKKDGRWMCIGFGDYYTPPVIHEEYKPLPPPELIYEAIELPAHLDSLNWVVKPGYKYTWHAVGGEEYESFSFCPSHDFFFGAGDYAIDERTGLYVDSAMHGAHGGGGHRWIYDPVNDLMGRSGSTYSGAPLMLYPRVEFAEHFPDDIDRMIIVYSFDSTMEFEEEWMAIEIPWDAHIGVSVAVGGEFVSGLTDIPDDQPRVRLGRHTSDKIEFISENGKYGVIGRDGSIILPFEFEGVLIIDNWTAFVQYGGSWGILAFEDGYVPDFRPSGENHTYISGDWLSERWFVFETDGAFILSTPRAMAGDSLHGGEILFEKITNHGGRNIRAFTNDGNDVFWLRVEDESLVVNQVRLNREWAGEIVMYNHAGFFEYFDNDVLTAVNTAEHIVSLAQDYLYGLDMKIQAATGWSAIQVVKSHNPVNSEDALTFSLSATNDNISGEWFNFEAVRDENGGWTVHDITQDIWG
jgi:hypothetical protein